MDQLCLIPVLLLLIIQPLNAEPPDKIRVVASLYGSVTLPCSFPFIEGPEGLMVVWEMKDKDGSTVLVHKFRDGQDIVRDQDIHYMGRTEMPNNFSTGRLDLTMRDVTFRDEGTYYCQTFNERGHGDKEVELTIGDVTADDSVVSLIHVNGKKRLKCIDVGVFRNPWVRWYNTQGKDLSEYGTRSITDIGDGRKMVESVLDMDVEANTHYFCQVREGRLRRTARAVLSDNSKVVASLYDTVTLPCSFPFIEGPEGLMVVWEMKDKNGSTVIAHKFIDGQDIVNDQDFQYTGRTEISSDFSTGRVDLTLRDVTFRDEGTYYCRAANERDHGDKEVELTIGDVNADNSVVTTIYMDGKKRLKCVKTGVFRNPWVRWYNTQGEDLSEYGTRNITDTKDGRKLVESVLDMDVDRDTHYFCQVRKGRLKRTARAVLSDGKPIAFPEIKLP